MNYPDRSLWADYLLQSGSLYIALPPMRPFLKIWYRCRFWARWKRHRVVNQPWSFGLKYARTGKLLEKVEARKR